MHDLGTLGGTNSEGYAVNNSGQVAGYSTLPEEFDGISYSRVFRYDGTPGSGGVMRSLGTLGGRTATASANESLFGVQYNFGELLAVHDLLDQFAEVYAEKAMLVKLRYFAGYTLEESAELLGVSLATAKRHWAFARAWLYSRMEAQQR